MREDTVDEYVDGVLAPLLLAEMRDKEAGQSEAELASRCAEIERQIREKDEAWVQEALLLRADGVSPRTIAVYEQGHDSETAKLRSQLSEARTLLREAHTLSVSLQDLSQMPPTARRDAIHACLRWVAVVPSEKLREIDVKEPHRTRPSSHAGWVVFLTAFGTYHTAVIEREFTGLTDHRQLTLRPARPTEVIGTVCDFPDPAAFLCGLERAYKGRKYKYNPADITPGFSRMMASAKDLAGSVAVFDVPLSVVEGT